VGAAIVFMLTSLSLALLSKQANTSSTVIDLHPTTHQESSSTSTPATTPPAETNTPESTPETTPVPNAP
jgi:hypothetical protein